MCVSLKGSKGHSYINHQHVVCLFLTRHFPAVCLILRVLACLLGFLAFFNTRFPDIISSRSTCIENMAFL